MGSSVGLFLASIIWTKLIPPNVLFGLAFLLLLFTLSKYPFKLIVNPSLRFLGTISYSAYLVHFGVLYWLGQWNAVDFIEPASSLLALFNYFFRLVTVLLITLPISYLSYQWVEKPMQKVGKWVIKWKE